MAGWRYVREIRGQPQSRGPRRGVRHRRRARRAAGTRLQRRPHQEGLRGARAVAARRGHRRRAAHRAGPAPAAGGDVGAGALMGQGPQDRQPARQRPGRDGSRQAVVPQGLRQPARPAAGRRLLRVVPARGPPGRGARRQGQAAQAAVLHPPARRWRAGHGRALRDLARPVQVRRRPGGVAVDLHRAHHRGRGRPRAHPRPDAAARRARALRGLAGPSPDRPRRGASPAGAGRSRAARGLPGVDRGQRRTQQRSAPARPDPGRGRGGGGGGPGGVVLSLVCTVLEVGTPHGPARLHVSPAQVRERLVLALGHGAGGGVDADDLSALAATLPACGVTVVRVEQPWRVAGKRVAPAPARLDVAWTSALAELAAGPPLVLGGRSAGARVACRTARALGAAAVLALAFPLHPPGRPERSRAGELAGTAVPTLVVQGERDAFGTASEIRATLASAGPTSPYDVVAIPGGDHGFAVPASGPITRGEALEILVGRVTGWLGSLLVRGDPGVRSGR